MKKVPLLRGKSVFNLFFENSTRTRTTFEIAAKRLSADVINLNISTSSPTKGESLLDTVDNLAAMHADMFVVRHAQSGAPHLIARHVAPHIHVINAGDGRHAHPTQGLLDATPSATTRRISPADGGDRRRHPALARGALADPRAHHARRARSARDRPADAAARPASSSSACACSTTWRKGLRDVDVVVMLRLQNERMRGPLLPSAQEFFKSYGLTPEKLALAKPDAIVMHPGPDEPRRGDRLRVADGPQSVILPQVTFGIAVRMAVMWILAGN